MITLVVSVKFDHSGYILNHRLPIFLMRVKVLTQCKLVRKVSVSKIILIEEPSDSIAQQAFNDIHTIITYLLWASSLPMLYPAGGVSWKFLHNAEMVYLNLDCCP